MTVLDDWFWFLLTMACVAWYSTITVYVGIRGALDIKHMLKELAEGAEHPTPDGDQSLAGDQPAAAPWR